MCKVLIVEDDLLIALDAEMALEDAGHTVVGTATTVEEAVTIAAEYDLDVMVVDLRLADGSRGPDAVERVRRKQPVEVVFVSGNLDRVTRSELARFAPLAMIPKPFSPKRLVAAVSSAGGGHDVSPRQPPTVSSLPSIEKIAPLAARSSEDRPLK